MIQMKFLSPALVGQPVSVTVTQGNVSRNLSVDSFGNRQTDTATPPAPDTGGEIVLPPPPPPVASTAAMTITARRGTQQIAPEGIAFFAEVSGFDAQPPADGKVYDPTLHDIAYTWTFGDPGEYAAPENVLTQWKNKNVSYGPFPSHVFATSGTYRVTCIASERSSGKTATASIDVTVQDPEAVFTAATTVICSTSGNFAGAPAHDVANRTTTLNDALARLRALKSNGQLCRVLFRAGEEFTMTINNYIGKSYHNFYASSFGTGRATIKATTNGAIFELWDSLPVSGASVSRLAFVGPWDSTTETRDPAFPTANKTPTGVGTAGGWNTIHDCTGIGLWQLVNVGTTVGASAIVSDCQATNWEDYGMYVDGDSASGYVGIIGCRFAQDPNALMGGNGKSTTDRGNRHGPLRIHGTRHVFIDVFDAFSRNSWWVGGTPTLKTPDDQPCIRDHRNNSTTKGFYSRLMLEGGLNSFGNGSASPDQTGEGGFHNPTNTVIDKAYFLGSARNENHIGLSGSAVTARNLILHRTNVGTGLKSFGTSLMIGDYDLGDFTEASKSEPIKIYNVTIVNELDDTQQVRLTSNSTTGTYTPVTIVPNLYNEGMVQVENLVVHRPNFTGGTVADAPLDDTRLGMDARHLGYEWKAHGSMPAKQPLDTSFATPANPYSLWRPQAGSPAIGSATGLVAYDDLLGNVRPAKASCGAVEPA